MRLPCVLLAFLLILGCKNSNSNEARLPEENPDFSELSDISTKDFREFKVLDSKHLTNEDIWKEINPQLLDFSEEDYERLKPFILERDITELQIHRAANKFTYEELVKFYLYRIKKYDRENPLSLNSVIAINSNVIEEARSKDRDYVARGNNKHPIYGMPILLKDNINASGMPTTAGAVALKDNLAEDAFIVEQLKSNDALILGKANLSEWAYFFCGDCPSGYSAIGGQTLNPYGRRIMDTGGSSSGSGVATSANFAAATIGSETAGSILSPASQNSVVGLKPTVGLVSRSGIVPISSTLDTAGPITKTVLDNAIVLDAIYGKDNDDSKISLIEWNSTGSYYSGLTNSSIEGKRFGAPKRFLEDTLYANALEVLRKQGATIVAIEEEKLGLPNFLRLLNLDMKKDLPVYMENYANTSIELRTVSDVVAFNLKDSINTMPYGQKLFDGIVNDEGDATYLERIKDTLSQNGKQYFDIPMKANNLDGFLSINNRHAAFAAVAEYPAITVPMGYTSEGEPKGLTFIAKPLQESLLLNWAYIYEQASKARIAPNNYN